MDFGRKKFLLATIAALALAEAGAVLIVAPKEAKPVYERKVWVPELLPSTVMQIPQLSDSDFPPIFISNELTPKQYGEMFGHGNKRKRTNLIRCKHNAKLKKRKR